MKIEFEGSIEEFRDLFINPSSVTVSTATPCPPPPQPEPPKRGRPPKAKDPEPPVKAPEPKAPEPQDVETVTLSFDPQEILDRKSAPTREECAALLEACPIIGDKYPDELSAVLVTTGSLRGNVPAGERTEFYQLYYDLMKKEGLA